MTTVERSNLLNQQYLFHVIPEHVEAHPSVESVAAPRGTVR
jgi:hypothetical protein